MGGFPSGWEDKTYTPIPLEIKDVIFNYPATIVFWTDDTKTIVKCAEQDQYDREKGLAMAICKKFLGGSAFKSVFKKYCKEFYVGPEESMFDKWIKSLEPAMQKLIDSVREVKKYET